MKTAIEKENDTLTTEELALWEKIRNFELDDPNAPFTFSERLARENGWTEEFSLRTIEEYKKFMFLICIAGHPLTPSDQVDQVWHLHLIYTQSYWIAFCQNTLQKDIHHGPTNGEATMRQNFKDWYAETKSLYQRIFKKMPPSDIWPTSEIRFSEIHFTRVNKHRFWVIPRLFKRR